MPLPQRRHTDMIRETVRLEGRRVLEIGCGAGALLAWLGRAGAAPIGLDPDPRQLARAAAARVPLIAGRGEALPFASGSFPLLLYMNSLHHVPLAAQWAAITEAARVLESGGELLVIEPLPQGPWFELLRPVDDETEIRQEARRALTAAAALGLWMAREEVYETARTVAAWTDARDQFLAADPARAADLEAAAPELARRFDRLGERVPEGRRFAQPMRLNLLRRTAPA